MVEALRLTCESAVNPLGIDAARPRFSWLVESPRRAQAQSAYHILVASSPAKLDAGKGDRWDSGKVASGESVNIAYEGSALASGERCWWKVRVWDQDGAAGGWSGPATFEMALLEKNDWHGKWIGAARGVPAPLLRKEFKLPGKPIRARLYVSGIGWSEAYLNGQRVSDRVLDPCASEYGKSVYYVCHDVTGQLKRGTNAIGLWLGNGWYSEPEYWSRYGDCPRALVQLDIELAGGKTVRVVSDGSWRATGSCIIMNDFWHGETYDARLELPGWNAAGFADSGWVPAERRDAPGGVLRAQLMAPIRVIEVRKPVKLTEPRPNVCVYHFDQLFGGWVRLRVKGPAGVKVTIKYSGLLDAKTGLADMRRHATPKSTDYYILKGDPDGETFEPRFTYHPVNYVQVEGAPGKLTLGDLDGCVVHTDEDLSGDFECSNELVNKIHRNVVWTLRNGLFGMPLDCLDREHWAWTDPATITGSLYPRKHMPVFWAKWLRDIADSQREDGMVPHICPAYGGNAWDPAWGGNYPALVWYLYRYYDDERLVREHYDGMKRCTDFMRGQAEDFILTKGSYGDHMLPGTEPGKEEFISSFTPRPLVWTGYFYRAALVMSEMAAKLGKAGDAKHYADLARKIMAAFNAKWLDTKTREYAAGSQTANAFALSLGIVPDAERAGVVDSLVRSITEKHGNHHHTGNTGTTCLIDMLAALGHGEVMWKIVTNTSYPGWGFMVEKGATTIWESWSLIAGCGNAESMIMWATIDEFFYNDIAGIKGPDYYGPERMAPGFRDIRIKPFVPAGLDKASASIRTVRGVVSSKWTRTAAGLELRVTVPANSRAAVSVPKLGLRNVAVSEGGKPVWKGGKYVVGVEGIANGAEDADCVTFDVGSGSYAFALTGNKGTKP